MKTVTVEISEELYEMLEKYAISRRLTVSQIVNLLVERFAPITHTMKEEELKAGYEESSEINLDWANL